MGQIRFEREYSGSKQSDDSSVDDTSASSENESSSDSDSDDDRGSEDSDAVNQVVLPVFC